MDGITAAPVILSILVPWFRTVHQNDEILALIHNAMQTDEVAFPTNRDPNE